MLKLNLSVLCLLVILSQVSTQFEGGAGFRIYNGMPAYGSFAAPKPKAGSCPPTPKPTICKSECKLDNDCVSDQKCCSTACGSKMCVPPMTKIDTTSKSGYCPKKAKTPWICNNLCTSDMDCEGFMKCCKNRCGAMVCLKADMYYTG